MSWGNWVRNVKGCSARGEEKEVFRLYVTCGCSCRTAKRMSPLNTDRRRVSQSCPWFLISLTKRLCVGATNLPRLNIRPRVPCRDCFSLCHKLSRDFVTNVFHTACFGAYGYVETSVLFFNVWTGSTLGQLMQSLMKLFPNMCVNLCGNAVWNCQNRVAFIWFGPVSVSWSKMRQWYVNSFVIGAVPTL